MHTNNKSILITGCSSGIGYCVAKNLQQRNYRVFATARKPESVAELQEHGFTAFELDLANSASIQACYEQVMSVTNGQLYALFNNGAYGQVGALEDLPRGALQQQFETNVFGWHELTSLAIKTMRQQGYGRIIQNSSILGLVSLAFRGAYNASKYAIEGLSDTLRQELRDSNIYISLIEPGPITSRFRHNAIAHFKNNIDLENSFHKQRYQQELQRLEKTTAVVPFTLPPEAVYIKVLKALEKKRPKPRYYVTFPTYLFGYLKRILSTRALDRLLTKI